MENTPPFADILEAAGSLSLEEQEVLVEILNRRLIEQRRAELAADIADADRQFQQAECRPARRDELLREIQP
ncbi:MAG: hypothetical protein ACLQLG_00115 [Thermoguttaceae bacterium]